MLMCSFLSKAKRWFIQKVKRQIISTVNKKVTIDETCTGSQFIMNKLELKFLKFALRKNIITPYNLSSKLRRDGRKIVIGIIVTRDDAAPVFLLNPNSGFFFIVNYFMNSAYLCTLLGLLPQFKWPGGYYQDSSKGPNVWKYFFKQPDTLPSLPDFLL